MSDIIEALGGRQTWMQAQIWVAGTAAMSLANAAAAAGTVSYAEPSLLTPPYNFSASSSYQTARITPAFTTTLQQSTYAPKTELGRKLVELRNRGIRSGLKLLDADEIRKEIAHRRGELP